MIAVLGLGAAACNDATLSDVTSALESTDLKSSKDTGEQAAEASADETEKIAKANRAVDEALESREPHAVDRAIKLRPRDSRYLLYRGAMAAVLGGGDATVRHDSERAQELLKAELPEASEEELERRWQELSLEVLGRTLSSLGPAPRAELYTMAYCGRLATYERDYTSGKDDGSTVEAQAFL